VRPAGMTYHIMAERFKNLAGGRRSLNTTRENEAELHT
jgi:hypothetical protein